MECSVVGSRKGWDYMEFKVVRTDRVWWCCAQRNYGTEAITFAQARRHNNSRATFDHFWWDETVEVANDNGSLFWMELNSHAQFYRHERRRGKLQDAQLLFEHKICPSHWVALQLLRYQMRIICQS